MERGRKASKGRREEDPPAVEPLPRGMLGAATTPLLSASPPPVSNPLDIPGARQSSPRTAQLGGHRPGAEVPTRHRRSGSFGAQDTSVFRAALPTPTVPSPSTSPRSSTEKGSPRDGKNVSKADLMRRIEKLEDDIVQAYDDRLAQLDRKLDTTIGALQARMHQFNELITGLSRQGVYISNPRGNFETLVQPRPRARYVSDAQQQRPAPSDAGEASCGCFSWIPRLF